MKIGDIIKAEFTDTSILGAGVARVDDMAVFCPDAVAGDIAEIEITAVKKRYAEAKLSRLVTPSADRISPDCGVFAQCGGCSFRHITYEAEAKTKEKSVHGALRRFEEIRWDPIFTGNAYHYRNKTVFHLDSSFRAGYYAAATNRFCYPPDSGCRLLPPLFGEIAQLTTSILQREATGLPFRALGIRQSAEGSFTAVLHAESVDKSIRRAAGMWADEIRREFPRAVGLFLGIGMPEERSVRYELLIGDKYLTDRFLGLELQISPAAFYQVNHTVAQELCRTVARYADLQPGEVAADLYCGTGTIGLTLAAQSPQATVMGIEIVESAVRDAVANAERNHLSNIHFRCGDSATAEAEGLRFDCIVIDPPRKGCSPEMIQALVRLNPRRIVYVSCNPATLARDAALLADAGWNITRAQPFDMFPRTGHCETVCLLTKKNFRMATQDDAAQVLSLYETAKSGAFCVWNESYPSMTEIEHDLETENLYVMGDGSKIIGAISVVPENELDDFHCWSCKKGKEIARVVIDKAYQGHGLSFEMVQNIVPILRKNGYKAIHLSVVKTNIPAYKTYIKAGFVVVGEAQMYGNDYYLMEKALNTNSLP